MSCAVRPVVGSPRARPDPPRAGAGDQGFHAARRGRRAARCGDRRRRRGARRAVRRGRVVLRALDDLARRRGPESSTDAVRVDHHRGSEENQAGWDHHDPELVDAAHRADGHAAVLPLGDRMPRVSNRRWWPSSGASPVVAATGPRRWRSCSSTAATACNPPRRLRRLDAARRDRRHAGDPRRLPRSSDGGRRRTRRSTCRRSTAAGSSWPRSTGSLRTLRRVRLNSPVTQRALGAHRSSAAAIACACPLTERRARRLRQPVVSIGSSTRTSALLYPNRQSCLIERVARPDHGERQDRQPVWMARRKAPSLNSCSSPDSDRVPSGKIITETCFLSRSRLSIERCAPARDRCGRARCHRPAAFPTRRTGS